MEAVFWFFDQQYRRGFQVSDCSEGKVVKQAFTHELSGDALSPGQFNLKDLGAFRDDAQSQASDGGKESAEVLDDLMKGIIPTIEDGIIDAGQSPSPFIVKAKVIGLRYERARLPERVGIQSEKAGS